MRTAVDTSALLSVFNGEVEAEGWMDLLVRARREGQLVVCDVVLAELAPAFPAEEELRLQLDRLGIVFEPITAAAAFHAGQVFRAYRSAGGPRDRLIPDFLIASHASLQADRLMAADRGYLRKYFTRLPLLTCLPPPTPP